MFFKLFFLFLLENGTLVLLFLGCDVTFTGFISQVDIFTMLTSEVWSLSDAHWARFSLRLVTSYSSEFNILTLYFSKKRLRNVQLVAVSYKYPELNETQTWQVSQDTKPWSQHSKNIYCWNKTVDVTLQPKIWINNGVI